jgi:prepilin-type processing-associated H-X9-DG protein
MNTLVRRASAPILLLAVASAVGVASSTSAIAQDTAGGSAAPASSSGNAGSEAAADWAAAAQARIDPLLQPPDTITVTEPLPAVPEQGLSVYWVTPNLQSQQPNTDALEAATEALGWKLTTLQTDSADPQAVPAGIQQALSGGADYIIVSGGSVDVYGEALPAAISAGVPIIDMYSTDEVGGESNGIYANVGGTGWIDVQYPATADYVIAHSGGDANVLYVDIPDFPILAAAADATTSHFSEACPECTLHKLDVSIADLLGGSVTSQIVSTLQRDEDIDYVFTSFGDLATGLPESLAEAGLDSRVQIVTPTPNADQLQAVLDGTLLAVVPNPKAQASWTAIDAIARLEQGLEVDEQQHTVIPVVVWVRDNIPTPLGDFTGAANYEEQFKQLWGVAG